MPPLDIVTLLKYQKLDAYNFNPMVQSMKRMKFSVKSKWIIIIHITLSLVMNGIDNVYNLLAVRNR